MIEGSHSPVHNRSELLPIAHGRHRHTDCLGDGLLRQLKLRADRSHVRRRTERWERGVGVLAVLDLVPADILFCCGGDLDGVHVRAGGPDFLQRHRLACHRFRSFLPAIRAEMIRRTSPSEMCAGSLAV